MDQTGTAIDFFHLYLPFTEMTNADGITKTTEDYCLAKAGEIYAIYLPEGGTTEILLDPGTYDIKWFNPRSGGDLMTGTTEKVTGIGFVRIGFPPEGPGKDWVCLIRKQF